MKRVLSDEEIQWRYIADLRAVVDAELQQEVLDFAKYGPFPDTEPRSWFGEILEGCELSWPHANVAKIVYPEWYGLSKTELELFESSDVVWAFAQVRAEDNRRVIEVLLVDYHAIEV